MHRPDPAHLVELSRDERTPEERAARRQKIAMGLTVAGVLICGSVWIARHWPW